MDKLTTIQQVSASFQTGMTVMIGGFLAVGTPTVLVNALLETGVNDLTLIGNDTAFPDSGVGVLVVNKRVKKAIVSHIGTNPETGRQMMAGEMQVDLVPQGTLAERIRAAGAGLGGVLTPTGVGTIVEEGKQKLTVDGKEYLLEKALKADLALIKAKKADKAGNLIYNKSARNFNPVMALAADLVIAEVEELVEVGQLDPDEVMTPGILVDKIIVSGEAK
ncbi:acetate CoA-transferase subunit alpha [Anaerospora sp.]|jgi:acetate CoA/acetoacetate CoA-transferase alpha subunit|uniref:acetate CoA-transferase subunit alpha n=1 Tax=Anaerospora sp. TaxID=1960278 RepID=UPI00289B2129|nr:acetate CoA-transferase subunit alpha [Anaerospora sp.]